MLSECRPKLEADPFLLSLFLCSAAISIRMAVEVMMMTMERMRMCLKKEMWGDFSMLVKARIQSNIPTEPIC